MGLEELRAAAKSKADDPNAILQALATGWEGALTSKRYSDVLFVCASKGKYEQVKMLGLLGADLSAPSLRSALEPQSTPPDDDPFKALAMQRRAAASSSLDLTDALQIQAAVLTKLRGQLISEADFNGASPRERVAFKGKVIAHLEESTASATPFLPDMKHSLVSDAHACGTGYRVDDLVAAFSALQTDVPTSFFWTSLTGSKNHAIDVVVRATAGGFVLTSCNRGDGAAVEKSGKAGALQSKFNNAQSLANALAQWTVPGKNDDANIYNYSLHNVMPFDDKNKSTALDYRPQKLQKTGNCATKSLFAAVSYLTGVDQETLENYKAMRRGFEARLTRDLQRIGPRGDRLGWRGGERVK